MTATLKRIALRDGCRCHTGWSAQVMLLVIWLLVVLTASSGVKANRTSVMWLKGDVVRAFAAHLQYHQLTHGQIVMWRASSIRSDASSRAALSELLSKRYVGIGTSVQFASQLNDVVQQRGGKLAVLIVDAGDRLDKEGLCGSRQHAVYDGRLTWLIVTPSVVSVNEAIPWAERALRGCNISVNSDMTLAMRSTTANKGQSGYRLFDVYSICLACGEPLVVLPKGNWTPTHGWQVANEYRESAVRRRNNFNNLTLRATTIIFEKPPDVDVLAYLNNETDNKQLDILQRRSFSLLNILKPMWNWRYEMIFRNDWGVFRNGTWSGALGAVINREADISVCVFRFTSQRAGALHYAPVLLKEHLPFIFRHPRINQLRNIFFAPFSQAVWWCVAVLMLIGIVLLVVQSRIVAVANNELCKVDSIVLVVAEAFSLQGPPPSTYGISSMRQLVLWLTVFSFLMLQFYGGFIVGSLLSTAPRSITTLETLYNSNLEIGMEDVSFNYEIFDKTTNKLLQLIHKNRICRQPRTDHIMNMKDGAQRIKRGGFAFQITTSRILHQLKSLLTDDEFCDLQQIHYVTPYQLSPALQKHSPYREHLAAGILQLRTSGLVQRNDVRWQVPHIDCSLLQKNRLHAIDLDHFLPAIIFLAFAHLVAIAVFVIELCVHRLLTHCRQRWHMKV